MKTFVPEVVSLRRHPELTELWLQNQIAENPAILGLGDLVLRDRERKQIPGGRLDLLLQDPDTLRRYEVEIQLGATDERHIIRTIEYWDIERKRYPQYEHCAVITAEDITSRFLNVISLFNGFIPLVAIKLQALRVDDQVGLVFTTVLDELPLGMEEDDEATAEPTDRAYWEKRGSRSTVALADRGLGLINGFAPSLELKYNRFYIGLSKNGQPDNFVVFKPQKSRLRVEVKLPQTDETDEQLDDAGVEVLGYDSRYDRYRLSLASEDFDQRSAVLIDLMRQAYEARR